MAKVRQEIDLIVNTGSIDALKKKIKEVEAQYKALGQAERESDIGKQLEAEFDILVKTFTKLDGVLDKYKKQAKNLAKAQKELSNGIKQSNDTMVSSTDNTQKELAKSAEQSSGAIVNSMDKVEKEIAKYETALDRLHRQYNDLIALGINLEDQGKSNTEQHKKATKALSTAYDSTDLLAESYEQLGLSMDKTGDESKDLENDLKALKNALSSDNTDLDIYRTGDATKRLQSLLAYAEKTYNKLNNIKETNADVQVSTDKEVVASAEKASASILITAEEIDDSFKKSSRSIEQARRDAEVAFLSMQQESKQTAQVFEETNDKEVQDVKTLGNVIDDSFKKSTRSMEEARASAIAVFSGMDKGAEVTEGSLIALEHQIKEMTKQYKNLTTEERKNAAIGGVLAKKIKDSKVNLREAIRPMKAYAIGWRGVLETLENISTIYSTVMNTIGRIGHLFTQMVDNVAEYSDALANAQKTTNFTDQEIQALGQTLQKVNTRTLTTDLLKLAEAGGRFALPKEEIEGFVIAIDKMVVALGDELKMDADEMALSLLKIAEASGLLNQFSADVALTKLGSAINELSQTTKAQADQILDYTTRLIGLTKQLNLSAQSVLALATTFSELGISAEVAATATNQIILNLGKNVVQAADIAGVAVDEFRNLLAKDVIQAVSKFAEGMAKSGKDVVSVANALRGFGFRGQKVVATLLALSNGQDKFNKNLATANREFINAQSILIEFNRLNRTFAAELQKLKKVFIDIANSPEFLDFFTDTTKYFQDLLKDTPNLRKDLELLVGTVVTLGKAFATVGYWVVKIVELGAEGFAKIQIQIEAMLGDFGAFLQTKQGSELLRTMNKYNELMSLFGQRTVDATEFLKELSEQGFIDQTSIAITATDRAKADIEEFSQFITEKTGKSIDEINNLKKEGEQGIASVLKDLQSEQFLETIPEAEKQKYLKDRELLLAESYANLKEHYKAVNILRTEEAVQNKEQDLLGLNLTPEEFDIQIREFKELFEASKIPDDVIKTYDNAREKLLELYKIQNLKTKGSYVSPERAAEAEDIFNRLGKKAEEEIETFQRFTDEAKQAIDDLTQYDLNNGKIAEKDFEKTRQKRLAILNKYIEKELKQQREATLKGLADLNKTELEKIEENKQEQLDAIDEAEKKELALRIAAGRSINGVSKEYDKYRINAEAEANKQIADLLKVDSANQIDIEKKKYDDILKIQKEALDKKEITQEQYNQNAIQATKNYQQSIIDIYDLGGKSEEQIINEKYDKQLDGLNELYKSSIEETDAFQKYMYNIQLNQAQREKELADLRVQNEKERVEKWKEENQGFVDAINYGADTIAGAFNSIAIDGENAEDVIKNVLKGMAKALITTAFQMIAQSIITNAAMTGIASATAASLTALYQYPAYLASVMSFGSAAGIGVSSLIAGFATFQSAMSGIGSLTGGANISGEIPIAEKGMAIYPKKASGDAMFIGGKPHSQGGTKFMGSDGTRFEAEKDEMFVILNKRLGRTIKRLGSLNAAYGGKDFGKMASGGSIMPRNANNVTNTIIEKTSGTMSAPNVSVVVQTSDPNTKVLQKIQGGINTMARSGRKLKELK